MNMEAKCLECGERIFGRSDKKFCNAQCRNTYNNRMKNTSEKYILETNRILRKNRSILKQLNPTGKSTVRREYLVLAGFDFEHFTRIYRTDRGNTYYMCYEFGYMHLENEKVLIINQQAYMFKKLDAIG
jgi:hypothetical protein